MLKTLTIAGSLLVAGLSFATAPASAAPTAIGSGSDLAPLTHDVQYGYGYGGGYGGGYGNRGYNRGGYGPRRGNVVRRFLGGGPRYRDRGFRGRGYGPRRGYGY